MINHKFVVYYDTLDKKFLARCLEIPCCTGAGKTEDEVIADCQDTIKSYKEYEKELFRKNGEYKVDLLQDFVDQLFGPNVVTTPADPIGRKGYKK